MNDILSGTYKGNTYRIKVECYPNTPEIKVQLLPVNAGERITMTQNLGQPLPRYQAFLCDGMLEVDSTAFMDYMEENDLATSWTTIATTPMYLPEPAAGQPPFFSSTLLRCAA